MSKECYYFGRSIGGFTTHLIENHIKDMLPLKRGDYIVANFELLNDRIVYTVETNEDDSCN